MEIVNGSIYLNEIKNLIIEYTNSLNRNLSFQDLEKELNSLEAKYTKPNGEILAALSPDGKVIGCVAYFKHNDKRCEMKRLYVKPDYRNLNIGEKLVNSIISLAKKKGYKEMVLDTIKPLKNAIYLYKKYGFTETEPYYNNPMEDVIYMKLNL